MSQGFGTQNEAREKLDLLRKASDFFDEGDRQQAEQYAARAGISVSEDQNLNVQIAEEIRKITSPNDTNLNTNIRPLQDTLHNNNVLFSSASMGIRRPSTIEIREGYIEGLQDRNHALLVEYLRRCTDLNTTDGFEAYLEYRRSNYKCGMIACNHNDIPLIIEMEAQKKDAASKVVNPSTNYFGISSNCHVSITVASPYDNQVLGVFVISPSLSRGKLELPGRDDSKLSINSEILTLITLKWNELYPNRELDLKALVPNIEKLARTDARGDPKRSILGLRSESLSNISQIDLNALSFDVPLAYSADKNLWRGVLQEFKLLERLRSLANDESRLEKMLGACQRQSDFEDFMYFPQDISCFQYSNAGLRGASR